MRKLLLILFSFLFCIVCIGQDVSGFQVNYNFLKPDGGIQKGLYFTVEVKSIIPITADSGIIVTINKFYDNKDIADVFPDSNLTLGKDIVINHLLYCFPSNETTYYYGKHIGMKIPMEAVIQEILEFNYSIKNGIKKSEIIKL